MSKNEIQVGNTIHELKIMPYEHHTKYHETDQMGIIHHSNYIKWMEEARMDLMDQLGLGYKQMEAMEIITPILSEKIEYHSAAHFDDTIVIQTRLISCKGNKMTIEYKMHDKETREERAVAQSTHCFMNKAGKPISLKHIYPELETHFFEFK